MAHTIVIDGGLCFYAAATMLSGGEPNIMPTPQQEIKRRFVKFVLGAKTLAGADNVILALDGAPYDRSAFYAKWYLDNAFYLETEDGKRYAGYDNDIYPIVNHEGVWTSFKAVPAKDKLALDFLNKDANPDEWEHGKDGEQDFLRHCDPESKEVLTFKLDKEVIDLDDNVKTLVYTLGKKMAKASVAKLEKADPVWMTIPPSMLKALPRVYTGKLPAHCKGQFPKAYREALPRYKGKRDKSVLLDRIGLTIEEYHHAEKIAIEDCATFFGAHVVKIVGWEADDVAGVYCRKAPS